MAVFDVGHQRQLGRSFPCQVRWMVRGWRGALWGLSVLPMKAPGPSGVPLLGVLPRLARDPVGLCVAAQRAYGPVVRLPMIAGAIYLLTEPDHVGHVLV